MLRREGFNLVTHCEEYGDAGHNLADPAIIRDCGLKRRVLLTGDQNLPFIYARELLEANIAVFVTSENNEGPAKWGPRIIRARRDIMRELARRGKPFAAKISTEGKVIQVRVYDGTAWKTIRVGERNPPHCNKQKEESELGPVKV